jgi:ribosomal protein L40E
VNSLCETCEAMPAVSKRECRTCRNYRLRTGRQRPAHLADRQPDLNYRRIVGE